jgi:hypothetical protein
VLLVVNQGEEESAAQESLFQNARARYNIQWQGLGPLPASFIEYRYPRYGWWCVRQE